MEKVIQNCEQKFGVELALDVCLQMLGELFQLNTSQMPGSDGNGRNGTEIGRCADEKGASPFAHNRDHFDGPCTALELWTLRFVFPLLQFLCLGGNLLNLLVYSFPYFGDNSSVHLLRAKAVANLFFVQCRLLEVLHAWVPLQSRLEWLYWHSRPWMITMGNLNGTISTWMTMFISLQTMICVLWPFSFRIWCGPRPTLCCLVGSVFCAAGIHSLFLITHEVVPVPTLQFESALPSVVPSFACFRIATTFRMRLSNAIWASSLERPYYWVQMSATIVLPILVMMVCTALVVSRFTLKPQLGQSFSQRRKCVIRLTVATTVSHLLLEGPAALGYAFFALRGASMPDQREWMCALTASNNVLSALNATIPFFLFLFCSAQFRQMSVLGIKSRISAPGRAMKICADDGPSLCVAAVTQQRHSENGMIGRSNRTRQLSFGGFPVIAEEEEEGHDKRHSLTPKERNGGRGSVSETTTALLTRGGGADPLL
ncbi:hypothetical protein niasHS_002274 [Heterodera schachtii]|uniref:G-protein coupled receptors family 1 profile domain-containing protein n=1 Tax=Heterodera schachtii TaxID=97005 RepID=A0ABD2KJY1_HETSC